MKFLDLNGLAYYNENLLNKVEDMIDNSENNGIKEISISNNTLTYTKQDGTSKNVTIEKANTANNAAGSVFQIYKDNASTEGGELQLQNNDGTFWNVDSANNNFRIFDSNGNIHLQLDKTNSGNDYFVGKSSYATNCDTVDGYHSYNFCYSTFTPSTNMNEVTASGVYRINSGNTNAPSDTDWGQLFVIHGGGDTIAQLIFDFSKGRCWLRTGNPAECNGVGSWTAWRELYTSQNITYGTNQLTAGSSSLATGSIYLQYE